MKEHTGKGVHFIYFHFEVIVQNWNENEGDFIPFSQDAKQNWSSYIAVRKNLNA